jgi:hypothetical protein
MVMLPQVLLKKLEVMVGEEEVELVNNQIEEELLMEEEDRQLVHKLEEKSRAKRVKILLALLLHPLHPQQHKIPQILQLQFRLLPQELGVELMQDQRR